MVVFSVLCYLFAEPFHPYLDDRKSDFLLAGRQFLSDVTRSSALRFQNLDLTYNLQSVYLLVTLLEVPDFMCESSVM